MEKSKSIKCQESRLKNVKTGKIKPNGVILQPHELSTVVFLTELGYNIELIPKSNKQGTHSADMWMLGLEWEMKSPRGEGKYLIQNTMHRAAHQSENLIIDLQRIKIHQSKVLPRIEKEFLLSRRLKRLIVITRQRDMLTFEK